MCIGCWEEDGRPWEKTERAVQWAPVFSDACGGPLHNVVDDWNLGDDSILWCKARCVRQEEVMLCNALLGMTFAERYTTALLADDPEFDPVLWSANRDD